MEESEIWDFSDLTSSPILETGGIATSACAATATSTPFLPVYLKVQLLLEVLWKYYGNIDAS